VSRTSLWAHLDSTVKTTVEVPEYLSQETETAVAGKHSLARAIWCGSHTRGAEHSPPAEIRT